MITIKLVREDDNIEIGTATIDESLCYATPVIITPPPTGNGDVLYLDSANVDYIQLDTPISYTAEFDFEITTQGAIEDSSYVPLFGDTSIGNRVLISGITDKVVMNIGGGALISKTGLNVDMTSITKTRLYRDSNNDVYIQINDGTPTFVVNNTNTFVLSKIAKSQSREFKGFVHGFRIGNEIFSLTEGSGNVLTSDSGNLTATLVSNNSQTYIDDYVWTESIPSGQAIQVFNEGVPNDNTYDLSQRITDATQHNPDLTIIMIGANDCLNTTKFLSTTDYETNLQTVVDALILSGSDVVLAYTPPTVSEQKKLQKDYTPIYGDESLLDLNVKLSDYRAKMDLIASNTAGCSVVDTLAPFTANGDPKETIDSYLRNPLNSGGAEDYVHPTNNGQEAIKNALLSACSGYTKIVCFGDSITYGVGAVSYAVRLSQELNS